MKRENSDSSDKLFIFLVVAKELRKIVKSQPEEIYSDPGRLSDLLQQNLGSRYSREIYLIVRPLKVNIIDSLSFIKDNKKLYSKLLPTINKIHSQEGYDEGEAKWAVYSWAYALDKVPEKEYYEINEFSHLRMDTSSEPIKDVAPEPIKDVAPEPIKDVAPEPIKDVAPEPIKDVAPEPIKDVAPEPIKDVAPEPRGDISHAPIRNTSPQPMKDVSPAPINGNLPPTIEDVSRVPRINVTPQPMKDVSPAPINGNLPPTIEDVSRVPRIEPSSPSITEKISKLPTKDKISSLPTKVGPQPEPSSIIRNNWFRILLGVVVAVGVITFIIFTTESTNSNPEVRMSAPERALAGQNVTVDISRSSDADGRISEFLYSSKIDNGPKSQEKIIQNASKIEFYAPPSENPYSLEITGRVKDNDGAFSNPAKTIIFVEPGNKLPIARINAPDNVQSGQNVTVDISRSSDADGRISEFLYSSKIDNGPKSQEKIIQNASKIEFYAPPSENPYSLEITGRVKDNDGAFSNPAKTIIFVEPGNKLPIARINAPDNVQSGQNVTVDISRSSDADGRISEFLYSSKIDNGPKSQEKIIQNASKIEFYAPPSENPYSLEITGRVKDNDGAFSNPAKTIIFVEPGNKLPIARINAPDNVQSGQNVTVDISRSSDADGRISEFLYSSKIDNGPKSQEKIIQNASKIEFYAPPSENPYSLEITGRVKDNDGAFSNPAKTIISASPTYPPIANAGQDRVIDKGDLCLGDSETQYLFGKPVKANQIVLDGNKSIPRGGEPLTYSWTQIGEPQGQILSHSNGTAFFEYDCSIVEPTNIKFNLIVTNKFGQTDSKNSSITVTTNTDDGFQSIDPGTDGGFQSIDPGTDGGFQSIDPGTAPGINNDNLFPT